MSSIITASAHAVGAPAAPSRRPRSTGSQGKRSRAATQVLGIALDADDDAAGRAAGLHRRRAVPERAADVEDAQRVGAAASGAPAPSARRRTAGAAGAGPGRRRERERVRRTGAGACSAGAAVGSCGHRAPPSRAAAAPGRRAGARRCQQLGGARRPRRRGEQRLAIAPRRGPIARVVEDARAPRRAACSGVQPRAAARTPAPPRVTRRALSGLSQVVGTTTSGTPASSAARIVALPPTVTTAAQRGSSSSWLSQSVDVDVGRQRPERRAPARGAPAGRDDRPPPARRPGPRTAVRSRNGSP